ncbi:hypothetical protein ACHAPT_005884 [Fusarium lateritium]
MASWGTPSVDTNPVTDNDFDFVTLPARPRAREPAGVLARKMWWNPCGPPENETVQPQRRPREVPCVECVDRMAKFGVKSLCRDNSPDETGKCEYCAENGEECSEVPESAFKPAYDLQVSARIIEEGGRVANWRDLSNKAKHALEEYERRDLARGAAKVPSNGWNDNSKGWGPQGNKSCDNNSIVGWNSQDNESWDDGGDKGWGPGEIPNNDNTKGWGPQGNQSWNPNDVVPSWGSGSAPASSVDRIISAINHNTNVMAGLRETMNNIKNGVDRLHEDNVQTKKALQKLLVEQLALGETLA